MARAVLSPGMRFFRVSVVGCVMMFAVSASAAPPTVTVLSVDPSTEGLSPDARDTYERERVVVEKTGPKPTQYRLRHGHDVLTEQSFRQLYRDVTHATDLDTEARVRAAAKNRRAIAGAAVATLVGLGSLGALAALQPSTCSKAAQASAPGGCGKLVLGVGILGLLGGYGLYALGCEAVKGSRCLLDGNIAPVGNELTDVEAVPFVQRYNAALVGELDCRAPRVRLGLRAAPTHNAGPCPSTSSSSATPPTP